MYSLNQTIQLAQRIVRGNYLNIDKAKTFIETSSIYRFTNENITAYFQHLHRKELILSVIGSGNQILNSILAGTRNIDCFDISIFPEFYLFLQLASIITLSKEEYFAYYLSNDREELFHDTFYEKIRENLPSSYQKFWDSLYLFDDGIDIYESMLFRQDFYQKEETIEANPFLQDRNYEKLKHILKTEPISIKTSVCNIVDTPYLQKEYNLVNLSNILFYYFNSPNSYKNFFETNFKLHQNGEIIHYFYTLSNEITEQFENTLFPNGKIEIIHYSKLLVYKK